MTILLGSFLTDYSVRCMNSILHTCPLSQQWEINGKQKRYFLSSKWIKLDL